MSTIARTARAGRRAGSVVASRQPARSGPSTATGRMTDAAAAATTTPEPARTQPHVRRPDRYAFHTAPAAARSSAPLTFPRTTARAATRTATIVTPATAAPTPSVATVRRRSGETA